MASLRWLLVLGVACGGVAVLRADPLDDEMKKLEGVWEITAATCDGKTVDLAQESRVTIAGRTFTIRTLGGDEQKYTFAVSPTEEPKKIDLAPAENVREAPQGWLPLTPMPVHGIYNLQGDTLKLVVGLRDRRPTEFTDKGHPLFVLERKK